MQQGGAHTFAGRDFLREAKAGFIYQRFDMITEILGQLAPGDIPDDMTEKVDTHCCVRAQKVLQVARL